MADHDGSIVLGTELDTSGINKGLSGIGGLASKGLKAAGVAIAAVGAGIVAVGKYATDVGSSFDSAMSQVAATMGTTVDQIGDLSAIAKEMGSTTQFTATEAAEALNYLALAGYDAEKQIAALPTVLNLAAAGDMDLAYASDLVTDSMAALGLETTELEGYADKLAKTAQTSNTSVSQLGEAVLVCGGQAKLAGMSVTDMNTALGILADNGIKGSEGGTALRNVLKNLYTPTSQAAKAMEELGLSTTNADGTLRDTQDVLKDLSAALGGLTEADRIKAMDKIFDTRTIAAANALLKDSGARWDELSGKIDNAEGAASNMAATMLDNLEGDVTIMKSALEGLGISIYENLRDPLREGVQWITEIIGQLNTALTEGGFEGLVAVIGDVLAQAVEKITSFAPDLVKAASSIIQSFLTGIVDNLPAIVEGLTGLGTELVAAVSTIIPQFVDVGIKLLAALGKGTGEQLPTLIPIVVQGILDLASAIITNVPAMIDAAIALCKGLVNGIIQAIPLIIEAVPELITGLCEALTEGIPLLLEAGVELFTALVGNIPAIIEGIVAALPEIITAIIDTLTTLIPAIIDAGIALFVALVENLPAIIQGIVEAIPQIIEAVINALTELIPLLIECGINLFVSLVENLPAIIAGIVEAIPKIIEAIIKGIVNLFSKIAECGKNLFLKLKEKLPEVLTKMWDAAKDIVTKIADGIKNGFSTIVECGKDLVLGVWEGIKSMASWLWDKVYGFFKGIVDGVKDFLGISSPSKLFKVEVGKQMAAGAGEGFTDELPNQYRKIRAAIDGEQASLSAKAKSYNAGAPGSGSTTIIEKLEVRTDELNSDTDYDRVGRRLGESFQRSARYNGGLPTK